MQQILTARSWSETTKAAIHGWFQERMQQYNKEQKKCKKSKPVFLSSAHDPRLAVVARLAPKSLTNDKDFMNTIEEMARRAATEDRYENARKQTVMTMLESHDKGIYLLNTLVDHVTKQAARQIGNNEWTVLNSQDFSFYIETDRRGEMPEKFKSKIAVIVLCNRHFVLLTCENGQIQIRDSLRIRASSFDEETTSAEMKICIGRFMQLHYEATGSYPNRKVQWIKCIGEMEVECGIMAINNLVEALTGQQGVFSRAAIGDARKWMTTDHDGLRRLENYRFTVVAGIKEKPSPPKQQTSPTEPVREPKAPSPTNASETKKPPCLSCRRTDDLYDNFCLVHHPSVIRNRRRCIHKSDAGYACRNLAISIGGIQRCPTHMDDSDRTVLPTALREQTENTVRGHQHQPYGHKAIETPEEKAEVEALIRTAPKPMTHKDLSKWVMYIPDSQEIEVTMERAPYRRTQYRLNVVVSPKNGKGIAKIKARYCDHCSAWHASEFDNLIDFPEPDVHYFKVIRNPPTTAEVTSNDCPADEEGSDVDSHEGDPATAEELEEVIRLAKIRPDEPERETASNMPIAPASSLRTDYMRGVFLYDRPQDHNHKLVYLQYAPSTRDEQLRKLKAIRAFPADLQRMPLPQAIVEHTLRNAREKGNTWSTISCARRSAGNARIAFTFCNCSS